MSISFLPLVVKMFALYSENIDVIFWELYVFILLLRHLYHMMHPVLNLFNDVRICWAGVHVVFFMDVDCFGCFGPFGHWHNQIFCNFRFLRWIWVKDACLKALSSPCIIICKFTLFSKIEHALSGILQLKYLPLVATLFPSLLPSSADRMLEFTLLFSRFHNTSHLIRCETAVSAFSYSMCGQFGKNAT